MDSVAAWNPTFAAALLYTAPQIHAEFAVRPLPQMFLLGAPKAGTTSLWNCLAKVCLAGKLHAERAWVFCPQQCIMLAT